MFNKTILTNEQETDFLRAEYLLEECYVDPMETMDHPPVALSYGEYTYNTNEGPVTYDAPIGTYGNFSFIQAAPKHNKTFLVSLLSAAYLGGNAKKYSGKIKGHREDKCLLHFDTEQGRFHAHRTFKRVLEMTGQTKACYKTYALRDVGHKERLNMIKVAVANTPNAGLVIVDGIADLMADVNNIEEANAVVQEIMTLTHRHNVHLMTVIHTNFGSDKPTGHLGSAMEKKAETQIQLERDTSDSNIIKVICKRSRSRAFDTFSFYVNNIGLPQMAYEDLNFLDNFKNDLKVVHSH
jgi:hypothetical protein